MPPGRATQPLTKHETCATPRSRSALLKTTETIGVSRPLPYPAFAGIRERTDAWLRANGLTTLLLGVILLFALFLRLDNVNWDKNQHLHPDERFLSIISDQISGPSSVSNYFDSAHSQLNPYNHSNTFVYGTFPIFLNKAIASWLAREKDGDNHFGAAPVLGALKTAGVHYQRPDGSYTFDGDYNSNLVGRVLSALFDAGTVALLFALGSLLYNRGVGLLAAGLLSITVLDIQYSHFFGSETFVAFFVTAVLYCAVRIWKGGGAWSYAFCGVAYGLALACKLSALPAIALPAVAILMRYYPDLRAALARMSHLPPTAAEGFGTASFREKRAVIWHHYYPGWRWLGAPLVGGVVLLLLAGLAFRIAQPYAFNGPGFFDVFRIEKGTLTLSGLVHLKFLSPTHYLDLSDKFVKDINGLIQLQKGGDFPPNLQWLGRTRYVFPAKNIVLWGLGLPLSLAFAIGAGTGLWRLLKHRDLAILLPLLWVVFVFWFNGRGFVPTMRYFIALYPAAALIAASGLAAIWRFAESGQASVFFARRSPALARWGVIAGEGLVVAIVAAAFLWAMAFSGIYHQPISRIQASTWIRDNVPPGSVLSFQEWDDGLPLNVLGVRSDQYKSVTFKPFLPDDPAKVKELIDDMTRTDYIIESSNRLYGTIPRIPARYPVTTRYYEGLFAGTLGFQKVAEFDNYPRLLGIDIPDQSAEEAFTVYDHPKVVIWKKTPEFSVARAVAVLQPATAGTAINVPPGKSATNALLLRPDDLATQRSGGTWTKIFSSSGIATKYPTLLWFLVLELAALAATPFLVLLCRRLPDRGYLLAKPLGLLLLGYVTWIATSLHLVAFERTEIVAALVILIGAGSALTILQADKILPFFRDNWRLVLFCEAVFVAAFLCFYELRLINPDLWHPSRGGEKPMDLAYLTAVTKSTTLPPYDPWFAGGYINYYYLGQFFTATLSKVTGIEPVIAFNLAVPTYFALTFAAAFSVAFNLAAAARRWMRAPGSWRAPPLWTAIATGLFGALLVCVAGNLDGLAQFSQHLSRISTWHIHAPIVGAVANSANGLWQVVFNHAHLQPYDYWSPSRALSAPQGQVQPITEFPYFTFLFADLHAHMMAIAFATLAIGVSLSVALKRAYEPPAAADWVLAALLGLICGSLRWLNSWDYPSFLLVAVAAILISERGLVGGWRATAIRSAGKVVLLAGLSLLLYWPFLKNYSAPVSGLHNAIQTTRFDEYAVHFGVFLVPLAAWLLFLGWRAWRRSPGRQLFAGNPAHLLAAYDGLDAKGQLWCGLALALMSVVIAAIAFFALDGKSTIAALLAPLLLVAYLAWQEFKLRRSDSGLRLFVLALVGLGIGLSIGVDIVTLNGDITRMNTVFKFYIHVWVVFALAASFGTWYLAFALRPAARPRSAMAPGRILRYAGATAMVLLIAGAAVYPVLATPERLKERFTSLPETLDGEAYMASATYVDNKGPMDLKWDLDGIEWMRNNVNGSPAIIEGRSDLYSWQSRFSIYTGLPTVLGWDWHQKQQRGDFGGPVIDRRVADVENFYGSPDPRQAVKILNEYDVRYVIVGQLEKLHYPAQGLAKFSNGLDGVLETAYQNPGLTIYRVRPSSAELAQRAFP